MGQTGEQWVVLVWQLFQPIPMFQHMAFWVMGVNHMVLACDLVVLA
jgi:hypothetical protein